MDEEQFLNETYEEVFGADPQERIALIAAAVVAVVPSILIDLFVIAAIRSHANLRTKRNLFLTNWCLADLVFQSIMIVQYSCAFACENANALCILYTLDVIVEILNFLVVVAFFVDAIYVRLNVQRMRTTMLVLWSVTVVYLTIESVLCYTSVVSYYYYFVSFFLHILTYTVYLLKAIRLLYGRFKSGAFWAADDDHEEARLRFLLTTVFVVYQLYHSFVVNVYLRHLWIVLYYVEHTQMISFFVVLIRYDVNFKLLLRNACKLCSRNGDQRQRQDDVLIKYNHFDEIEIN